MSAVSRRLTWSLSTPWPARGAIATIQIRGDRPLLDTLLLDLGAGEVAIGRVAVREVAGIDKCVLARFDEHSLFMFPHAGKRILELIGAALESRGAMREARLSPRHTYPEANDDLEARMLAALAEAASPLAIDLLLDQPRRWRDAADLGEVDPPTARARSRLLHPPLIAAVGLPNVGKSSLLNALAGRTLSVVADEPGTTRDHVGATLDLGGLTVRWIDCPGFRAGESDLLQVESQRLALAAASRAHLLLICGDAASGFPDPSVLPSGPQRIWVALRADLGLPQGDWSGQGPEVSVRRGTGLPRLVTQVREALVPEQCLKDPRPWRFWDLPNGDSESM